MEHLPSIIIGILLLIIFALLAKVWLLRRSAQEIAEAFHDRLTADTNILIDISTRDPYMRKLAADINVQLRLLRKERHRYQQGDRELKEAVTNLSHDLRTPLTAICGYLDLLEREERSEVVSRYLALIKNRTEAMKNLTEELFRYSVILSAQTLKVEPVCVNDVLEESLAGFYGVLSEQQIIPEIVMTERKLVGALDRAALGRVFGNILNNALKYSGGDLRVTLSEDGKICFSNTARNLDGLEAGRLFDRFYTVESARNSTGLGLSIAKTLTERMDGTIHAVCENGKLRISLWFPCN